MNLSAYHPHLSPWPESKLCECEKDQATSMFHCLFHAVGLASDHHDALSSEMNIIIPYGYTHISNISPPMPSRQRWERSERSWVETLETNRIFQYI